MSMFMFLFMDMLVVVFVVVVVVVVVSVLVHVVVAVLMAVLVSMLVVVVVVVPVLVAAGVLSITSCGVVLVVDGSNNWHGHGMGNWNWEGNSLVGVHPVQSMADDRGNYRVVTSVASVVETSNSVTPIIGLLGLSVALLRVEPFLRLVCSRCQLSIWKGQHLFISDVVVLILIGWLIRLKLAAKSRGRGLRFICRDVGDRTGVGRLDNRWQVIGLLLQVVESLRAGQGLVEGLSIYIRVDLLWVGIELLFIWLLKGWLLLLLLLLNTAVRIRLNRLWQALLLLKTESLLLLQHHVLLLQGALLLHQLKGLLLLLLPLDVQRLLLALQVQVLLVFQRVDQVTAKAPALKNIFWLGLTFPLKHLNIMIFALPQYVLLVVWEERGCRKKRLRGGMRFISNDRFHNCRINCEGFLVV